MRQSIGNRSSGDLTPEFNYPDHLNPTPITLPPPKDSKLPKKRKKGITQIPGMTIPIRKFGF